MRRAIRWTAIAIGGLLGLAVVVLIASLVAIRTAWFHDWVRRQAESRVSPFMTGQVGIGALSGSLLHDVTLHNVVLRDATGPVVSIASLTVHYAPFQLIHRIVGISDVTMDGVTLDARQRPDGWNLADLVRPRASTSNPRPWTVSIGHLHVTRGEARVEPRGLSARRLDAITFDGGLAYAAGRFSTRIDRLDAVEGESKLAVHIAALCTVDSSSIHFDRVTIATSASQLAGHVAYDWRRRTLDSALDMSPVTMREWASYLPASVPTGLIVSGHVQGQGPLGALATSWSTTSQAGAIDGQIVADLTRAPLVFKGSAGVRGLDLSVLMSRGVSSAITASAALDGAFDSSVPAHSRVSFSVTAPLVTVAGYTATAVRARGTIDGGIVRASGTANAYGAAATFTGTVAGLAPGHAYELTTTGVARHVDIRALPATLKLPALSTDVSGRYTFNLARGAIRGTLDADASTIAGARVDSGTTAGVAVTRNRLEATVDGRVENLTGQLMHLPASGRTALSGTVHGALQIADISKPITFDGVDGNLQATLGASTVQNVAIDRADVDASLSAGLIRVNRLEVDGQAVEAHVQGTVAVGASTNSDLSYDVAAPDLSALSGVGVAGLQGTAHMKGQVQGALQQLTTTGTFDAEQFKYGNDVDAVSVSGTFTGALPNRDLGEATGSADLTGALVKIRSAEIQRMTAHADYRAKQIDFAGHAEQPARALDVAGAFLVGTNPREIHLRSLTLAGAGAPWTLDTGGQDVVVRYGTDTIGVDHLAIARGGARVEGGGVIALTAAGASGADFKANFSGVDVGSLYPMASGAARVTGTGSGSLELKGLITDPAATANVEIDDAHVATLSVTKASARVDVASRRVSVDARVVDAAGNTLTAQGAVPFGASAAPMDLRLQGTNIGLGLVEAFTSAVDHVQGSAALDLRVTGALSSPSVTGTVGITNGGFHVAATGVTYTALGADVQFDGARAAIRQLSIHDDDGHVLTATGTGDVFSSARAIDITVHTDDVHVLNNNFGVVEVTADLHATGQVSAPNVTGRIAVTRGVIQVDQVLAKLTAGNDAPTALDTESGGSAAAAPSGGAPVPATGSPSAASPAASSAAPPTSGPPGASTGLLSRAQMDVTLAMQDNVILRGNNLRTSGGGMGLGNVNVTIGGDIKLQKTPGKAAVVVGSLTAVRGSYSFQNRRFDLTRGSTVAFRGQQPIDPALNLTGERQVSGITATVHVTGTSRRPRLSLSSSPPLEEGDVLALIIFNEPIDQLGDSEQIDLVQKAGELAASAVAGPLAASIGQALDLDVFEISAPSSGQAGEVNVGHQVSDRLFVGFRQEFGEADTSRLSFEYRLTNALRVLTSFGEGTDPAKQTRDNEAAGVDFLFTVRY